MTQENKFNYIGRLFVNKSNSGKTYLKGKLELNGVEVKVVGFANELTVKNKDGVEEKVKAFSIALADDPIKQPISGVFKEAAKGKPKANIRNNEDTDF